MTNPQAPPQCRDAPWGVSAAAQRVPWTRKWIGHEMSRSGDRVTANGPWPLKGCRRFGDAPRGVSTLGVARHGMDRLAPGGAGGEGFSLVEVLVALVLFLVAAAFVAQLLQETAQQLADAAAEQVEAPMPLVRARMRSDVQASQGAVCVVRIDGTPEEVRLLRHPAGTVLYRVDEGLLWRQVEDDHGHVLGEGPVLRGVESWSCADGGGLLWLQLDYRRRAVRRTPLVVEPGARGPLTEIRHESLLAAPRGAGLEAGW
jgi:prepilin-type N-terminal cleavage/methylation domain-containing protein